MKFGTWFAGVGIGIETYNEPGYPLFLDVRKYLKANGPTAFFYLDGGVVLPSKRSEMVSRDYRDTYSYGFYSDAGIGYKFAIRKKARWLISGGYSYRKLQFTHDNVVECQSGMCWDELITYYSYMHRFSIKFGVQF